LSDYRKQDVNTLKDASFWNHSTLTLDVQGLCVRRGGRTVLQGLDFHMGSGAALAVTGPNGCGKSTLLRALGGLLKPESGRISAGFLKRDEGLAEQTHLIGHKEGLKDGLSVGENLALWTQVLAGCGGMALTDALAQVGLGALEAVPSGLLSAGQRRRLALARLLTAPRPLWLLDEPVNALDASGVAALDAMVAAHRAQGGMVVAATHVALGWADMGVFELTHFQEKCDAVFRPEMLEDKKTPGARL
jgi:heme exporter protein A